MALWNLQVYTQGKLVSSDVVEEDEVQPMTHHLESKGYEVRSELAWKPAQSASRLPAVMRYPHQSVGIQTN